PIRARPDPKPGIASSSPSPELLVSPRLHSPIRDRSRHSGRRIAASPDASEEVSMPEGIDPTFYRSPAAAIAAPPEQLAYVAAFDPAGGEPDAMTVVDCDAGSPSYGQVVGWADLPTAGNELPHFGWYA